jgi:molybdenum cofactor cytidylyltransferase
MFRSFAIVPAAGHSRRMGRPKLLLPDGEVTVIETVLTAWQASRVTQTVVVVRQDDQALAETCRQHNVSVVIPDKDPPEMKDSVVAALDYLRNSWQPRDSDVWLLAPADLPDLSPAVIDLLLQSYEADPSDTVVPIHDGRRGHPVLFRWSVVSQIALLGPDEGINCLVDRLPLVTVAAGESCLAKDLDTPEQYHRRRQRE